MAGLVLIMGIPASGKTTLSKKLEVEFILNGIATCRVSFDEFPMECKLKSLKEKHTAIAGLVRREIKKEKLVLLDDTFHLKGMRQLFWGIVKEEAVGIAFIQCELPLEAAMREDQKRAKPVGEQIIRKIHNAFEPLTREQSQFVIKSHPPSIESIIEMLFQSNNYLHRPTFSIEHGPAHELLLNLNRYVHECIGKLECDESFEARKDQLLTRKRAIFNRFRKNPECTHDVDILSLLISDCN